MSRSANYDRAISVFSPEGRLFQIEYAFKAVKSTALTSVGVRGKDCVVFVGQKKVPHKLVDPTSVTNCYALTPTIGCIMTGIKPDAVAVVQQVRQDAAKFLAANGYTIPVHYLARLLADKCQTKTQHAGMRVMGVAMILGSVDEEKGAQLYQVDPAGSLLGWRGVSSGEKFEAAQDFLSKELKEGSEPLESDAAIELGILALQTATKEMLHPETCEIGVCLKNEPFRMLTAEEIEARLLAIAERDE